MSKKSRRAKPSRRRPPYKKTVKMYGGISPIQLRPLGEKDRLTDETKVKIEQMLMNAPYQFIQIQQGFGQQGNINERNMQAVDRAWLQYTRREVIHARNFPPHQRTRTLRRAPRRQVRDPNEPVGYVSNEESPPPLHQRTWALRSAPRRQVRDPNEPPRYVSNEVLNDFDQLSVNPIASRVLENNIEDRQEWAMTDEENLDGLPSFFTPSSPRRLFMGGAKCENEAGGYVGGKKSNLRRRSNKKSTRRM